MDCTWRLDRSVTPNRLDVVTPDGETFLAIAEFAPDGALLVDCNMPGSSCRPDRPEDFTAETWTLRRSGKAGR